MGKLLLPFLIFSELSTVTAAETDANFSYFELDWEFIAQQMVVDPAEWPKIA